MKLSCAFVLLFCFAFGTSRKVKPEPSMRLPRALKPIHYRVKLQPFINGNFKIFGYVEIEIMVMEATSNITLHIADIITYNETVSVMPSKVDGLRADKGIAITKHQYVHEYQLYIVHLEKKLRKGKTYILSMYFQGYLQEHGLGFFRTSYKHENGKIGLLATTHFQPTYARRAFPCFDEPDMKATFEVSLARQKNMASVANMPIKDTVPVQGQEGWLWDHYYKSLPMSTYLLGFFISDFGHIKLNTNGSVLFRAWTRKSALNQAIYATELAPRVMHFFEKYFGLPYPLRKMDLVAVPDFEPMGMENWGIIMFRETAMLYKPRESTATDKLVVSYTMAHEVSHQWFGNLVTPRWWTDIWLNEGFASYLQYLCIDYLKPEWRSMDFFVVGTLHRVFLEDSLESSHPISIQAEDPGEIMQLFDAISYFKGASLIRMMNHFLTAITLRKGLNYYLTDFMYRNADQDDLWDHLTTVAHADGALPKDLTVKRIMDTWTLQKGYPVVHIERDYTGTTASIFQEHFLQSRKRNSSGNGNLWWIPLTYTTQAEANFIETRPIAWLQNPILISALPSRDQWVIFNIQRTGFYRVNYDTHNWRLLIRQLTVNYEVIHPINRAQIVDDALNLADVGIIPYETALSLDAYLFQEKDFIPLMSALDALTNMQLFFMQTEDYDFYKKYMLKILGPRYDALEYTVDCADCILEQQEREVLTRLSCTYGYLPCLQMATYYLRQWMKNPKNKRIIPKNLKRTVYCYGIAEGGKEEWEFVLKEYHQSDVPTAQHILVFALGCSRDPSTLVRYLLKTLDSSDNGFKKQDILTVFRSLSKNPVGLPIAWEFLRKYWNEFDELFAVTKSSIIASGMSSLCTEEALREAKQFQKRYKLEDISFAFRNVLEAIKLNIDWKKRNYDRIVKYFVENP